MEVFIIFGCLFILWAMFAYHRQQRERDLDGVPYLGALFDSIGGHNHHDDTVIEPKKHKFAVPASKHHSHAKPMAMHSLAQDFASSPSFQSIPAASPCTETAKPIYKRPGTMYGIVDQTAVEKITPHDSTAARQRRRSASHPQAVHH